MGITTFIFNILPFGFGNGISLGRGRVEDREAIPLGPVHGPAVGALDGGAGALDGGAGAVDVDAAPLELCFLLAKAQCLLQRVRCSGVNDPAIFGGTTNLGP